MSLFEFVLVMVSLVIAIGITHLLQAAASIVRHRRELELDWIPLLWMATLFLYSVGYWWSLWDFRDVQWTFPEFFFLLIPPTLLYAAVSLMVSADFTVAGMSMTRSFERVRQPFVATVLVFQLLVTWDGWVFGTEPVWNQLRWLQLTLVILLTAGTVGAGRRIQAFVALGMFFVLTSLMLGLRFLPGAFGPG
ncbi:MAG: hypothetical protein QNJ40_14630 [Xanthomonadales bacterium]|nr:hypothetical protein [Xanthomonadales bacterium]